jgi:hypothetical protein
MWRISVQLRRGSWHHGAYHLLLLLLLLLLLWVLLQRMLLRVLLLHVLLSHHILWQVALATQRSEASRGAQHIHVQLVDPLLPRRLVLLLLLLFVCWRMHPLLLLSHQLQLLV